MGVMPPTTSPVTGQVLKCLETWLDGEMRRRENEISRIRMMPLLIFYTYKGLEGMDQNWQFDSYLIGWTATPLITTTHSHQLRD